MNIIYYIILFFAFITASAFISRDIENKKVAIVKSTLTSLVFITFLFLINVLINLFFDIFTGPGVYAFSYTMDIILPVAFSVGNIIIISKFFKYEIKVPIFLYVIVLLCAVIVLPFYLYMLKAELSAINYFSSNDDVSAFGLLNLFTSFNELNIYRNIVKASIVIPQLSFVLYFVVKKLSSKKLS